MLPEEDAPLNLLAKASNYAKIIYIALAFDYAKIIDLVMAFDFVLFHQHRILCGFKIQSFSDKYSEIWIFRGWTIQL